MFRRIALAVSLLSLPLAAAAQSAPPKTPPPMAQPAPLPIKPSFDCATAKSKAKLLICGDDELAKLDLAEDALLRRARAKAVTPDAVNADQDLWISQRDGCTSAACLTRSYRQHIQDLHAWAN